MATYSLHSPKNKFSVDIHFNKPVKGLGSCINYTSGSIEGCEALASIYKNCSVLIRENKQVYPQFEWVTVKEYKL